MTLLDFVGTATGSANRRFSRNRASHRQMIFLLHQCRAETVVFDSSSSSSSDFPILFEDEDENEDEEDCLGAVFQPDTNQAASCPTVGLADSESVPFAAKSRVFGGNADC